MSPSYYPLVSVVIPTYNRKIMLKKAIDSVLLQDYENIEVIVSDNASGDGTNFMMEGYCKKYSNIKYIQREKNIGAHPNGYLAYKQHATGEYLYFLSDDDYLMSPTFFSHAVEKLEQYPNLKIVSGIVLMEYTKQKIFTTIPHTTKGYVKGYSFLIHMWTPRLYGKINEIIGQFFMVRKADVDALECFEWFHYGDMALKFCLSLTGDIYFLHETVGCYCMHEGARDATDIEKVQREIVNVAKFWAYIMEIVSQNYSNRVEFFKRHLVVKLYDNTIINMMDRIEENMSVDRDKIFRNSQLEQNYPYVYHMVYTPFFIGHRKKLWKDIQAPGIKQSCKQILISYRALFFLLSIKS